MNLPIPHKSLCEQDRRIISSGLLQFLLMFLMFRNCIKEDQVAHQDPVAAASTVPATTAATTGVATTALATTVAATTAAATVADATSKASTTSTVTDASLQMSGSRTPTTMTVVVMRLVGGFSVETSQSARSVIFIICAHVMRVKILHQGSCRTPVPAGCFDVGNRFLDSRH